MIQSEAGLRRELGARDLTLFAIASIVGVRWIASAAHAGPGSILLWGLAALFFTAFAIGETLATPDVQAKVRLLAAETAYADDETFAAFLATESARWKEALAAMPASN